jgi:hypothetical protein
MVCARRGEVSSSKPEDGLFAESGAELAVGAAAPVSPDAHGDLRIPAASRERMTPYVRAALTIAQMRTRQTAFKNHGQPLFLVFFGGGSMTGGLGWLM